LRQRLQRGAATQFHHVCHTGADEVARGLGVLGLKFQCESPPAGRQARASQIVL